MASRAAVLAAALASGCLIAPASAAAAGNVSTAALQVALRARSFYQGTIDGYAGPLTRAAVRALERRAGLPVDGIAGPRVRRALGRLGRPRLGSRAIRAGDVGWDVSGLQFRLAWHGFPSGDFDGDFGPQVDAAMRGFQRWAGLRVDGDRRARGRRRESRLRGLQRRRLRLPGRAPARARRDQLVRAPLPHRC